MRNIFTLSLLFISAFSFAQDGELDPNYGTDGKQIIPTTPAVNNTRQRIVVLPDGSFVQSFTATSNGNDFGLAKFLDDGSPDPSFGTNGIVTTDFGANETAIGVDRTSDGKFVVIGYKNTGGVNVFAIARYLSDGTLDASFNGTGMQTVTIGANDNAYALAISGTTIYVGGSSLNNSTGNTEFAIVKILANGTLDPTFSGDGKQTTVIGSTAVINDIDIQIDGRLVAAGYSRDQFNVTRFAVTRYATNGNLDGTFNGGGIATTAVNTTGNNDVAYAVTIQPSTGTILAAGSSSNGTDLDFALVRYLSNGTLDNTLDGDGRVTTSFSDNDIVYAVSLQADGKIIAAGTSGTSPDNDFAIARYTDLGLIDNSFNQTGTPGYNRFDFGPPVTNDYGYDIGFQGSNVLFSGVTGTSLASAKILNSSLPLPFYLLNFSAQQSEGSVLLRWQTATEEASSRFEILRSTDGRNFTRIGSINASGNSTVTKSYSYVDSRPVSGISYYRLKMVNQNGSSSYSRIVIVRSDVSSTVLAFPNPVRSVLNLQLSMPAGPVQLNLFDVSGRLVRSSSLRSTGGTLSTTLDMSTLHAGTYFLKLNEEFVKLVKQ